MCTKMLGSWFGDIKTPTVLQKITQSGVKVWIKMETQWNEFAVLSDPAWFQLFSRNNKWCFLKHIKLKNYKTIFFFIYIYIFWSSSKSSLILVKPHLLRQSDMNADQHSSCISEVLCTGLKITVQSVSFDLTSEVYSSFLLSTRKTSPLHN